MDEITQGQVTGKMLEDLNGPLSEGKLIVDYIKETIQVTVNTQEFLWVAERIRRIQDTSKEQGFKNGLMCAAGIARRLSLEKRTGDRLAEEILKVEWSVNPNESK